MSLKLVKMLVIVLLMTTYITSITASNTSITNSGDVQHEASLHLVQIQDVDSDGNDYIDEMRVNATVSKYAEYNVTSSISLMVLMHTVDTQQLIISYTHKTLIPNGLANISFSIPAKYFWSTFYTGDVHLTFVYFNFSYSGSWGQESVGSVTFDLEFDYTVFEKPHSYVVPGSDGISFMENDSTGLIEKLKFTVTVVIDKAMDVSLVTHIRGEIPAPTYENAYLSGGSYAKNVTAIDLEHGLYNISVELILYKFHEPYMSGTYFIDSELVFNEEFRGPDSYQCLNLDSFIDIDHLRISPYPITVETNATVIHQDVDQDGIYDELLLVYNVTTDREVRLRLYLDAFRRNVELQLFIQRDIIITPDVDKITYILSADKIIEEQINYFIRLAFRVDWYVRIGVNDELVTIERDRQSIFINYDEFLEESPETQVVKGVNETQINPNPQVPVEVHNQLTYIFLGLVTVALFSRLYKIKKPGILQK